MRCQGGAIYYNSAAAAVTSCSFSDNTAVKLGECGVGGEAWEAVWRQGVRMVGVRERVFRV